MSLVHHFFGTRCISDNSGSCAMEVRRFVDEAVRMKEFDHPNVLSLIGVALDFDNLPLVVLPFMRHGDLLSYIRNEAHVSSSQFSARPI